MDDWIFSIFSLLCHQLPDRSWAPGGILLPCCHRCAGLYAGALGAATLLFLGRPRMSGLWLWLHGLMLLVMVPFGFHWLPQGAELRSMTGVCFGFAVVAFLWLLPATFRRSESKPGGFARHWYWTGLVAAMILIPTLGKWGGQVGSAVLRLMIVGGALVLTILITANLLILLRIRGRASGWGSTLPTS